MAFKAGPGAILARSIRKMLLTASQAHGKSPVRQAKKDPTMIPDLLDSTSPGVSQLTMQSPGKRPRVEDFRRSAGANVKEV
jgi:hypothetical protein